MQLLTRNAGHPDADEFLAIHWNKSSGTYLFQGNNITVFRCDTLADHRCLFNEGQHAEKEALVIEEEIPTSLQTAIVVSDSDDEYSSSRRRAKRRRVDSVV